MEVSRCRLRIYSPNLLIEGHPVYIENKFSRILSTTHISQILTSIGYEIVHKGLLNWQLKDCLLTTFWDYHNLGYWFIIKTRILKGCLKFLRWTIIQCTFCRPERIFIAEYWGCIYSKQTVPSLAINNLLRLQYLRN